MKKPLFRQKSLDRVSSPEQLDAYMKVSSPGIWMILGAVIILLAGVFVWSVFGRLETVRDAVVIGKDGTAVCWIREEDAAYISEGMTVSVNETDLKIGTISDSPAVAGTVLDQDALLILGLDSQEMLHGASLSGSLPDGVYEGKIVVEQIAPISFLLD